MNNSQKGQTIIEAIVALMTILLIISAIAIVMVNGLYNSTYIKNQNEANKLAQQGMEFVRDIQTNNLGSANDVGSFVFYVTQAGTYCINGTTLTSLDCSSTGVNTGASYNRTITFSQSNSGLCGSNSALVTVDVKWSSTKCPADNTFCHKSELQACLPYQSSTSQP